ncbi:exo-alpha-sialidase [Shewanella algae]|uniref:exo-alpha-sialidase n=1 Tax=Shewanella algae TaxID=38313 RepID=UPI001183FDA5|nr:exo-alpha-sialidase [Shewanella algae]MBO2649317.1 exo-alpha-sialidase [Shewanella algae]TVL50274.1 hypothetical protein AYI98_08400 [Shewanella algae]
MQLISHTKIWDQGEHNAFCDLCRWQGALYCVFREGQAHVSDDGALRVLKSSDDGQSWQAEAFIQSELGDLRDGKLLAHAGCLWLFGAASKHGKAPLQSLMWHSLDGINWSAPEKVVDTGYWLWRVTEAEDGLYGVGYRPGADGDVRLYRSERLQASQTGKLQFTPWVAPLQNDGYVNESSLLFRGGEHTRSAQSSSNTEALCLLRRDPVWDAQETGLLGRAKAPFKTWQWQQLSCRIGGPVAFFYNDRLLAVVRLYDNKVRTSLVEIDSATAQVTELLTLPSGGDTSYAGIELDGDELKLVYYSSHEGKTAIYFARIGLKG